MIVLFWSRATRDLLRSFGWGIAALHRLFAATKLPRPRRPPHSVFRYRGARAAGFRSIPGITGVSAGLLNRYHLLRLEPLHRARLGQGLSRLWLAALRGGEVAVRD